MHSLKTPQLPSASCLLFPLLPPQPWSSSAQPFTKTGLSPYDWEDDGSQREVHLPLNLLHPLPGNLKDFSSLILKLEDVKVASKVV